MVLPIILALSTHGAAGIAQVKRGAQGIAIELSDSLQGHASDREL